MNAPLLLSTLSRPRGHVCCHPAVIPCSRDNPEQSNKGGPWGQLRPCPSFTHLHQVAHEGEHVGGVRLIAGAGCVAGQRVALAVLQEGEQVLPGLRVGTQVHQLRDQQLQPAAGM